MRIAQITAGAAGMYCGSCIHDNTLAAALKKKGADVALIPTYTPLRTDEVNVSIPQVFYGGINVFLQQNVALFRHTPWILDNVFDRPSLLNLLARFSLSTNAPELGALTVSVLQGEQGRQKKELAKLIKWLKEDYKPDLIQLTNSLFAGLAREMKKELGVPVLCAFQGEDIFWNGLGDPYKSETLNLIRERSSDIHGFISPCRYYAEFMRDCLNIPDDKIHVVNLGINLKGHGKTGRRKDRKPFTIGYLARICPEKGLHVLIDAFHRLTQHTGLENVRLRVAGYLGKADRPYFDEIMKQINSWGLTDGVEYLGEVDRVQKIHFLNTLHVLSVPTPYQEPKGLFILEALANEVPVVQPRHGAFPELIEATGGGILVDSESPEAISQGILQLMNDEKYREKLGRQGKESVHQRFSDDVMAEKTLAVYQKYL